MNKYGAKKIEANGYTFDSLREHARYIDLLILERAGLITDLEVHPQYILIEPFTDNRGKRERGVSYKADFRYVENGKRIVEDVKSGPTKTPVYIVKRQLLKLRYPEIEFREVMG